MNNQSKYSVGAKIQDSGGNTFTISSIIPHRDPLVDCAVTLKGAGGEKEIGSLDLKFYSPVYSPEIIKAHAQWRKAENKVPSYEYHIDYKKTNKAAQRKWRVFNDLCVKANLLPVTVAHDILHPDGFVIKAN